jgi:hypothetical protein
VSHMDRSQKMLRIDVLWREMSKHRRKVYLLVDRSTWWYLYIIAGRR